MSDNYTRNPVLLERADAVMPTLLGQIINGAVEDHPAVQVGQYSLSYRELLGLVEVAAGKLLASEVEEGDRILVNFPNCVEHIVAILAVHAVGGIAVPVGPEAGAVRLAYVVKDTKPKLSLIAEGYPALTGSTSICLKVNLLTKSIEEWPGSLKTPTAAHFNLSAGEQTDALIRYTSGSTGYPKGTVLKNKQLIWSAQTLSSVFGIDKTHRELIITSMALSGAWQRVATTLYAGGCVVFSEGPHLISGILEDIQEFSITGFFAPPPLVRLLLSKLEQEGASQLDSCRTIEIGSASITGLELETLKQLVPNARIFYHYGMTECSRAVILDTCKYPEKLNTVGRPAPGVELSIRDEDGQTLGNNEAGQIFLRGFQQTDAYWNRPDLNEQRFKDGWLVSGDIGMVDMEGFVILLGRQDDMINSGGYSFFPAEVENELGPVEDVVQYVVAGISDPNGILNQVPWLFVVPAVPENWSPNLIFSRARKCLPPHMVPRRVIQVPDIPVTPSGKPDRRRIVELYAAKSQEL